MRIGYVTFTRTDEASARATAAVSFVRFFASEMLCWLAAMIAAL
jgi:hypothetical protein